MLGKEIKTILSKKAIKADKFRREAYLDLKAKNASYKSKLKKAKKAGDREAFLDAMKEIDVSGESQYRTEVNGTVEFNFRNTVVSVKRSYLERLKDPAKYVNKMYLNKTLTQIKRLESKGKTTEASGLIELAWKTNDKIITDSKKQKSFREKLRKINKKVGGKDPKEFNIKRNKDGTQEETSYAVIHETAGNTVNVTVI